MSKFQRADFKTLSEIQGEGGSAEDLVRTSQIYDPENDQTLAESIDQNLLGTAGKNAYLNKGEVVMSYTYAPIPNGQVGGQFSIVVNNFLNPSANFGEVCYSNDGKYLAIVNDTDLEIYYTGGDSPFNKGAYRKVQKATYFSAYTDVTRMAFSADDTYLAIGMSVAPYVKIFKTSDIIDANYGVAATELVATHYGTDAVRDLAWGRNYFAVAHAGGRSFSLYVEVFSPGQPVAFRNRNSASSPDPLSVNVGIDGVGRSVDFSHDTQNIILGLDTGVFQFYSFGGFFTGAGMNIQGTVTVDTAAREVAAYPYGEESDTFAGATKYKFLVIDNTTIKTYQYDTGDATISLVTTHNILLPNTITSARATLSKDGDLLITACVLDIPNVTQFTVFDLENNNSFGNFGLGGSSTVRSLAVSPDTREMVVTDQSGIEMSTGIRPNHVSGFVPTIKAQHTD